MLFRSTIMRATMRPRQRSTRSLLRRACAYMISSFCFLCELCSWEYGLGWVDRQPKWIRKWVKRQRKGGKRRERQASPCPGLLTSKPLLSPSSREQIPVRLQSPQGTDSRPSSVHPGTPHPQPVHVPQDVEVNFDLAAFSAGNLVYPPPEELPQMHAQIAPAGSSFSQIGRAHV